MEAVQRFVLARPRTVLVAFACLWVASALGIGRLEIATDGKALVSPRSLEVARARDIDAEFGVGDELVLVVGSRDERGIWDERVLAHLRDLARGLAELGAVDPTSIQSLATERGDIVRSGTIESLPWLEPWPQTARDLAALRERVERIDLYRGTLLSTESPARGATIVFRLDPRRDRRSACTDVQRWLAERADPEIDTYLVGAALAESRLGDHLIDDMRLLVPVAFGLMGLVLLARFLSPWAALLPLCGIGFVLTTTFGLMGWIGSPIYLTLLVLPVVLAVVGMADAVHLLDDHFECVAARAGGSRLEALREALARQWKPILAAELTTAVGFVSFVFSPLPPVRTFGVFATLGVALYSTWSLAGLPAAIALLERRGLVVGTSTRPSAVRVRLAAACTASVRFAARRPWILIVGSLATIGLCVHGIARVRVEDSWVSGFSRTSTTWRDAERFERSFGGIHVLRLRVSAQAVAAHGRIARAALRSGSVLIPDRFDVGEAALLHHRLRLVPTAGPDALGMGPRDLDVVGMRVVEGGTEILAHDRDLPNADLGGLWPSATQEFDYELTAADRFGDPDVLGGAGVLETFLEAQGDAGVSRVLGPCGHLRAIDVMLRTAPEVRGRRLSTRASVGEAVRLYDRVRGAERRRTFWNDSGDAVLITVLVRGASYEHVAELLERVREFESRSLTPHGLRIELGGDLARNQALITGVVHSQVGSLLGSVLGNAVVIAFALGSLRRGLLAAVPCAMAVTVNFALMGWLDVSLGVATSLFAAMAIGVGIDWAIHLVRAIRRQAQAGQEGTAALQAAFEAIGPAVAVDAISVGLGFGTLLCSSVPPSRHLGLVLVTSLAACLVATFLVLPALLALPRYWPLPLVVHAIGRTRHS